LTVTLNLLLLLVPVVIGFVLLTVLVMIPSVAVRFNRSALMSLTGPMILLALIWLAYELARAPDLPAVAWEAYSVLVGLAHARFFTFGPAPGGAPPASPPPPGGSTRT
jgi:hypothetical protein